MSDNYSESYNSISSDSNFSDCDSDSSDSSDSTFSHTREIFLGRQNFSFRRKGLEVTVTVSLSLNSQ